MEKPLYSMGLPWVPLREKFKEAKHGHGATDLQGAIFRHNLNDMSVSIN